MKILVSFLFVLLSLTSQSQINADMWCEHKRYPVGIDVKEPRLSWAIKSPQRNTMQSAYEIQVATAPNFSAKSLVWQSGKVISDQSALVKYGGKTLESAKRYYWRVKVWDQNQKESPWTKLSDWEMGLLDPGDWKAEWIEPVQDTARHMPALMVRKDFSLAKKIRSARAYVTSHGFYELYLNGNKVGDEVLAPGWTAYQKRLQYQVFDVTGLLKQGDNAIGAMLGDGWYRGTLAWNNNWGTYGKKLGLLAQLDIVFTDGTTTHILSDGSWKGTQDGPITMNGIYDGESYDARKEITGWNRAAFNAANWKPVQVASYTKDDLVAMENLPIRKTQEIKPVRIFRTPSGTLVADFGQNMVGWVRLKMRGAAGKTISIRHAEVLDKFGEFYTKNLRIANASTQYTFKGNGEEVYEPRFTFMGFRYISVENLEGDLTPENVTGIVIHSDLERTGSFECSDPLINQLQHNIQWGQRGNFLDVPTDCPQRDERLGWTGDAQAFCRTAAYNMNVAPFFSKWLKDLAIDQDPDGKVPFVIPDVLRNHSTSAGWGDVSAIAPWTMYQVYGDREILANQYKSMKAYVEYIRKTAGDSYIWKGGSIFGDWLFYKPEMNNHTEPDGYTSPDLIATAFYAYSSKLVSQAAAVLHNTEDEKFYKDIFEKVKQAFIRNYVTSEGRIFSDSQTAYVLALMFDLLPEELKEKSAGYLVEDIKRRHNHLSTGFLGTPYLCHVLSRNGKTDVAYDLLLQQTFPSWLYPVKMGATTIWERWDGQKPDSSFQDEGMNSFNHYAYGAIGDWMYRVVAGLEIGSPGYKEILIQPHPDKRLQFAKAEYESDYGTIASGWEIKDGQFLLHVKIPVNTTATVILPGVKNQTIKEGSKNLTDVAKPIEQGDDLVFKIGSGEYNFSYSAGFLH